MVQIIDNGKAHTVVVERRETVAVTREVQRPVHVSSPGPAGPAGAPGPAGEGFTFNQATPASTWTINHNLGRRPAVELYDAGGNEFAADVVHLNQNTVLVTITIPVAGFARLN